MEHRRAVPSDLAQGRTVEVVRADLANPESLRNAVSEVDQIIHFGGVLFRAGPERFLPRTNLGYFRNLVEAAVARGTKRVILVSFPHVEGPSSADNPATGRFDRVPISVHAQTRLQEERYLFSVMPQGVSLRVGMVYGRGVLMIDAARWLARHRLLGVWRDPTLVHLISKVDFCRACEALLLSENTSGVIHAGDEDCVTLQEFLDRACAQWGCRRPWRLPLGLVYSAAWCCERYSQFTGGPAPLTKDFVDIGRVSYHGDTTRFRREILPHLEHPTLSQGLGLL